LEVIMPFWIAAAILGGSVYQATEASKAASKARNASAAEARKASVQMQEQISAQQEQAKVARERLASETAKYSEQKASLEAEAKATAATLEAERRKLGEEESSKLRARVRSGRRALLSDVRINPEMGVLGADSTGTLGASINTVG
jgi:lipoprotein-anchoring transpeptidase ErfK/SrfK